MKLQLNARLGVIENDSDIYGFGKQSRWWGYRIIQVENEINNEIDELAGNE